MMFTYQTRVELSDEQRKILEEYARLMSSVERFLFAQSAKGHSIILCKNPSLITFGLTARQFNACRIGLEGKIKACQASQQHAVNQLKEQIASLDEQIKKFEKQPSKRHAVHQKKRRRYRLQKRLEAIQKDIVQKCIRLCFGGRKLFNAQFYLKENGFASHEEWKQAWDAARNSEFFAIGSKDETAGNQTCQIELQSDGTFCIRLRLPPAFEAQYGKYLIIPNITFAYGHQAILNALHHPNGQAISFRFKKDEKGWRVFVSTAFEKVESTSKEGIGAIGIDMNADHVACVETDRFGNVIRTQTFSFVSYGKSNDQLKALIGDLCKAIIDWAKETNKPVVIEDLDFQKKKLSLKEDGNKKFSRLLSSFAYGLFFEYLKARAYREGVSVHSVNPAFTSIIGRVNYAKRYGLSIHLAAALCIARRYQKFSESPCSTQMDIPDGRGGHVAFALPVRNQAKHVWHFWGKVKQKLKTVLAAHFRAMNRSSSPVKQALETAPSS